MKKNKILTVLFLSSVICYSENINSTNSNNITEELPHIYTYIDSPVVEQRQSYTKEEIEKTNSENLTTFLQSKGIQTLSYGSYGMESKPSIRGFTDETIKVVIDGICVNNAQYGTFDFSTLNISNVEKIEIVKGGFSEDVSSEGTVGGTIYITTKKQTIKNQFFTDSIFKSFFYKDSPLDSFTQKFGANIQLSENSFLKFNLKGSFAQNQFPFKNYKNSVSIRKNSQIKDFNTDVIFSNFFGNGNNWNISNSTYYGNKQIPGPETSTTFGIQKDYNEKLSFNIIFPEITEKLNFQTNLSYLFTNRFYEDHTKSNHILNNIIFSASSDFNKFSFYKQSAGINFNLIHLNSTDDGQHLVFSGNIKETSKFFINDFFSVSIPLSACFNQNNFEFVPKIGFSFKFKYFEILLNSYRIIQFPTMDDLYWKDSTFASGNKDLKAESGLGSELTINAKNKIFPFSVCFFTNYYKDKIQWASDNHGKWTPKNIASAFYFGIDFNFSKTFLQIFTISGNVEYLYNELLDKNNSLTYKKRIMLTPDFVGSLNFEINTDFFYFSFNSNFVGKKYTSNLNTNYTTPYFLLNTNFLLKCSKKINPYIKIENLLNTKYQSVPEYPMPGISLSLGIKSNF